MLGTSGTCINVYQTVLGIIVSTVVPVLTQTVARLAAR